MKNIESIKEDRNWFALYVNVRHEKRVMDKLLEKGIEAYVPIVKQMRQWSDRKKMVEMPLFTGYVFVKLLNSEMDKPRWVEGVINFLKFENRPALIRNEEIEGLKFFVKKGYSIVSENNQIEAGQKVKINLAQFKGLIGRVDEITNNDFVLVYFEGIGQNFKIKAPVGVVKVVKKIIF